MSGDLGSLIIFRNYVLYRWLDGQHAWVDLVCQWTFCLPERGWSWAGSSSGGPYPYHVCIYRSFPWVCSVSSEKSSWVFSLEYACLSSFLETEWEKGAGSLPLSFRVSIYSPYFRFYTPYSPSTVPEELTQVPQWALHVSCRNKRGVTPLPSGICAPMQSPPIPPVCSSALPVPATCPLLIQKLSVGIRPSASLCCPVAHHCFLPFRNVLRHSVCCHVFPCLHRLVNVWLFLFLYGCL